MKNYSIFVLNISAERWKKYENQGGYTRFQGIVGEHINVEEYPTYCFYWNKKEHSKKCSIALSEGHMNMMKHIYENKIENAIIIEDDALIDFDRLHELDNLTDFTYIGGRLQATVLKNDKLFQKEYNKESILSGINKIDTTKYIISGAHGCYFPTYKIAKLIFDDIDEQPRVRAIDVELKRVQKKRPELIGQFIFPAISTLYLPDAEQGFTYFKGSSWKLQDDNKYY